MSVTFTANSFQKCFQNFVQNLFLFHKVHHSGHQNMLLNQNTSSITSVLFIILICALSVRLTVSGLFHVSCLTENSQYQVSGYFPDCAAMDIASTGFQLKHVLVWRFLPCIDHLISISGLLYHTEHFNSISIVIPWNSTCIFHWAVFTCMFLISHCIQIDSTVIYTRTFSSRFFMSTVCLHK